MRTLAACLLLISGLLVAGCYEAVVNPIKSDAGEPVPPVQNLEYSISETGNNPKVVLTWTYPSDIPGDIIQPVSVEITAKRWTGPEYSLDRWDTISEAVVRNAPTKWVYDAYDPSRKYRFIVKIVGEVDTSDKTVAQVRYSLGEAVVVAPSQ